MTCQQLPFPPLASRAANCWVTGFFPPSKRNCGLSCLFLISSDNYGYCVTVESLFNFALSKFCDSPALVFPEKQAGKETEEAEGSPRISWFVVFLAAYRAQGNLFWGPLFYSRQIMSSLVILSTQNVKFIAKPISHTLEVYCICFNETLMCLSGGIAVKC